jgi:hypothetical protein
MQQQRSSASKTCAAMPVGLEIQRFGGECRRADPSAVGRSGGGADVEAALRFVCVSRGRRTTLLASRHGESDHPHILPPAPGVRGIRCGAGAAVSGGHGQLEPRLRSRLTRPSGMRADPRPGYVRASGARGGMRPSGCAGRNACELRRALLPRRRRQRADCARAPTAISARRAAPPRETPRTLS